MGVTTPTPSALGILLLTALFSLTACSNDFHNYGKDKGKTPPLSKYTVSFNGNGAESTPAPISSITSGSTITDPGDPVWKDNVFEDWYNGSTKWDFATSKVTSNITLTAKWQYTAEQVWNKQDFGDYAPTIARTFNIPSSDSFADAKNAIEASGGNYILNITGDVDVGTNNITPYAGSVVSLRGGGTIQKTAFAGAALFHLTESGSKLILRDAALTGFSTNDSSLVTVDNSTASFDMIGGTISGNTTNVNGGGVFVGGGTFTMSGGTISGNHAADGGFGGGGVLVGGGTFDMNGGTIKDNTATGTGGYGGYGGGVYVIGSSSIFTMNDGTISGNTASDSGGGVYVLTGTFTKTGGTINGDTDTAHAAGEPENTVTSGNNKGHAVNVRTSPSTYLYRDATAGPGVGIDTTTDLSITQGTYPWQ
ncbi:hypothetical protein FACS189487_09640 [Campylobacterota bacterium]|nr:hypothetical protein FACS189487_09640 [Campylobacterota bacterium]